jgi:nanoRNase/pAp phosphatase (c-di-AMP/oligoRNAs hydrolase)
MQLPDVVERTKLYEKYSDDFKLQINKCSTIYDNLVILDLRDEEILYPGNRFMIYAMYPKTNISIYAIWGYKKEKTVYAVGKSIINKTSKTNVGKLMLKYDGGGHKAAGTCQIENSKAKKVLDELIIAINNDG